MIRYLVLGMQRSGTTVLHEALAGHPQVSCVMAEVDPVALFARGTASFAWGNQITTNTLRHLSQWDVFDWLTGLGTVDARCFGVKIALSSEAQAKALDAVCRAQYPDLRVLRIRRRDTLAQFISKRRAEVRNVWNSRADRGEKLEFAIPLAAYADFIINKLKTEATITQVLATRAVLELEYERDFDPVSRAIDKSCDFLGLSTDKVLHAPYTKTGGCINDVCNYSSLRRFANKLDNALEAGASADDIEREYALLLKIWRTRRRIARFTERLRAG